MKTPGSPLNSLGFHLVACSRRVLLITLIGLIASQLVSPVVGWASPRHGNRPDGTVHLQSWTLSGGGSSQWILGNQNGVDPITDRVAPPLPGLALEDANLGSPPFPNSAYDAGLTLWVNNHMFVAPDTVTVTTQSLTAGPVLTASVEVTVVYYAVSTTATLRTLASFYNPTDHQVTLTVGWKSNVGSDSETAVRGSSSGDPSFSALDRWVITSDSDGSTMPYLTPVNTHVFFGPDAPPAQPISSNWGVFADTGGFREGVGVTFKFSVPPGATRRLLFFNQMNPTNEAALAAAAEFNRAPAPDGDLLAGLSLTELREIVNWRLPTSYLFLPMVMR